MNSDNGYSRRTVLHLASGAALAGFAAVGPGGVIERAMAQAGGTLLQTTTSGVRLRNRPRLSGAIIGTLNDGEVVTQTGPPIVADGITWLPVTGARGPGFAASQFFTESQQGGFQVGNDVVTTNSVRLRRQAGLGAAVIRTLEPGTHAVIRWAPVRKDGFTWYGVILNDGTEGFVAGDFLTYTRVEPTGGRLRVVDGPLRLRQNPGLNGAVVTTLPTGATLFIADATSVTRDGQLWRYVQVEANLSQRGWVADAFTVPID